MNAWNSKINDRPAGIYRPDVFAAAHADLLPDTPLPDSPSLVAEAVLGALAGLPENIDALVDGAYNFVVPVLFTAADVYVLPVVQAPGVVVNAPPANNAPPPNNAPPENNAILGNAPLDAAPGNAPPALGGPTGPPQDANTAVFDSLAASLMDISPTGASAIPEISLQVRSRILLFVVEFVLVVIPP